MKDLNTAKQSYNKITHQEAKQVSIKELNISTNLESCIQRTATTTKTNDVVELRFTPRHPQEPTFETKTD